MNPKDFLKNYWRNLLLVTINLFALSMIFFQGIEMEMDKKKMSGRFAFFTIPIALTHILYDTPMNYVGYRGIVNYFKSEGGGAMLISGIPLSEALRDESKLNVEDKEDFPWKLNDLGGIAYSALAFKIFGLKTESHYYFYFLILGASVLCYVVYFFKNRFNLMLSVFLLSGVYVTLFILGLVESQFGSIYGLRNLGILSLVALLHIVMILDEGKPFNIKSSFFITIQTLILVFVYFCRSSIMWQFGVIFVALLTLFFLHRKKFTYLKKK